VNWLASLVGLIGLGSAPVVWPALPQSGFITGRLATVDDVKQGNAVFSQNGEGKPLGLPIPQYVWWKDNAGKSHPMILLQAEEGPDGTGVVGLRDLAGKDTVATLAEVKLLGTKKPQ
jgi:hypothetical protein